MANVKHFLSDESGAGSYVAGGLFFVGAVMTGLALDVTNAFNQSNKLQIAADAAALAAAANIDDITVARAAAMESVRLNLGASDAINENDIAFGHVDEDTLEFVAAPNAEGLYTAVSVDGFRTLERNNEIATLLVNLIGFTEFEANRSAVSAARMGGGGGALAACEDATVISNDEINTGGGTTLMGAVCLHGANGVKNGGNDTYDLEVRFSAEDINTITLNSYEPSDVPEDHFKIERTLEPVILPQLETMHAEIWADVSKDCNWNNGDWEVDGVYSGTLLPSYITDENGNADLVCWKKQMNVNPGELQPHTVYVTKAGINLAGNVQQDNIAIISEKRIGVGGGDSLAFDEVFFFADDISLAGNITWGPRVSNPCAYTDYRVYLFGLDNVSLGGWNGEPTVRNVVAVGDSVSPGGNMSAAGLYIETNKSIQLGGGIDFAGCGETYTSEIEIADTSIPEPEEATGSFLMR